MGSRVLESCLGHSKGEGPHCLRDVLHDIGSIASKVGLESPLISHKRKSLCTEMLHAYRDSTKWLDL